MSRGLRTIANRLANLLKLGSVARSRFAEATQIVQATMLTPDDVDDMSWFGDMGVAFRLNEGAEIVTAQLLGGNTAAIGTNQRGNRPTEKPGGGEVPEGCGGLHMLGSWRVYVDNSGNVYVGDINAGTYEKIARADKVDAELARIWTVLTTWTVAVNDGGGALQTAAIAAEESVATTASDSGYVK